MKSGAAAGVALVVVLAAGGCASRLAAPEVGRNRGRIEPASALPAHPRVQIYRVDADGIAARMHEAEAPLDARARFETGPLAPGPYVLALRSATLPLSLTSLRVEGPTTAVLRPVTDTAPLLQLRIEPPRDSAGPIEVRLTHEATTEVVVDRREATIQPGGFVTLRGLRPGRWRVDLPRLGWTTEIILVAGAGARDFVLDPPPLPESAAVVTGVITDLRADPAPGLAVTIRPLAPDTGDAQAWGRLATSDRDGAYRVVGVAPGPSHLRVERRERLHRRIPAPRAVTIPPSGEVRLGFVVEP